jgi:hypothetical protein
VHLDHLIYVADATGLAAAAARLGAAIDVAPVEGGVHTTFGTGNALLPLARSQYLEVVAVHDPHVAAGSPFGSAVAAHSAAGGGWLGWAVRVDDPEPVGVRLARPLIPGGRRRPDGVELAWRQVGTDVLTADPLLPFFLTWDVPPEQHPAAGGEDGVRISAIALSGGPDERRRLGAWLDGDPAERLGVDVEWVSGSSAAGLVAVDVRTPSGVVRLL